MIGGAPIIKILYYFYFSNMSIFSHKLALKFNCNIFFPRNQRALENNNFRLFEKEHIFTLFELVWTYIFRTKSLMGISPTKLC